MFYLKAKLWNYGIGIDQINFSMIAFIFDNFLPQAAFFGFVNTYTNKLILENHIILLSKIFLSNSRKLQKVILRKLIRVITKVKDVERESARNDDKKIMLYKKRWQNIENAVFSFKKNQVSFNNDPNV